MLSVFMCSEGVLHKPSADLVSLITSSGLGDLWPSGMCFIGVRTLVLLRYLCTLPMTKCSWCRFTVHGECAQLIIIRGEICFAV